MPVALNGERLVRLIPELEASSGSAGALASLANVTVETHLHLRRLNLTAEQSEDLKETVNRALGHAAMSGVKLGMRVRQPIELDGLVALNRFVGAAIRIGVENVTQPKPSESAVSPEPSPPR